MNNKPTLLTICHDPTGALLDAFQSANLYLYYEYVVINATASTNKKLLAEMEKSSLVIVSNKSDLSNARRHVLSYGYNHTKSQHFHYCDLDRLLFWSIFYPTELMQVTRRINTINDFTVYGRTKKAMRSHPLIQRVTEQLINMLYAYMFRSKYKDLLAASRSFNRSHFAGMLRLSQTKGPNVDVEWPAIFHPDIRYYQVDGLGYESDHFGTKRSFKQENKLRLNNLISMCDYLLG